MTDKSGEVLEFWFEELNPKQWFNSTEELDEKIYKRFGGVHDSATKGELDFWRVTPEGSLADKK